MARNATKKSIARQWKRAEARVAAFFGTTRTPLSGGNSKQTRSDTLSDIFYIEHKSAPNHAATTLLDDAKRKASREGKLPMVALHRLRTPGFVVCIHSSDLDRFARLLFQLRKDQRELRKVSRPPQSADSTESPGVDA